MEGLGEHRSVIAFTCLGIAVAVFVGLPLLFILLDTAAAKIARALHESMRP